MDELRDAALRLHRDALRDEIAERIIGDFVDALVVGVDEQIADDRVADCAVGVPSLALEEERRMRRRTSLPVPPIPMIIVGFSCSEGFSCGDASGGMGDSPKEWRR